MKNKFFSQWTIGSVLLIVAALAVSALASCNAIADTSGLNQSPETVWISLTPSVALEGSRTTTLVLDFSKAVDGLVDTLDAEGLGKIFTFVYKDSTESGITATDVKKTAVGIYTLSVINVPNDPTGIVLVTINKSGISPATRIWSLDGKVVSETDMSASLRGFRFTQSDNAALLEDVVGGINHEEGTVVVVLPIGVTPSSLIPTITMNPGNQVVVPTAQQTNWTRDIQYTIRPALSVANQTQKTYTVSVIEQTRESASIKHFGFTKEENSAAGMSASVSGVIDEDDKTISVLAPYGTDLSKKLKPNITHSGASISPPNLASQNFNVPVKYSVTAADGRTNTEYMVTVTVGELPPDYGIELSPGTGPVSADDGRRLGLIGDDSGFIEINEKSDAKSAFFPKQETGYQQLDWQHVTVKNIGNQPTGPLTITLEAVASDVKSLFSIFSDAPSKSEIESLEDGFEIAPSALDSIVKGGAIIDAFAVRPKTGLVAGMYRSTVTVRGGHGISVSFNVSFSVTDAVYVYAEYSDWDYLDPFITAHQGLDNREDNPAIIVIIKADDEAMARMDVVSDEVNTAGAYVALDFSHYSNNFENNKVTQGVMSDYIKNNIYIKGIALPEFVETIDEKAFIDCTHLSSVILPLTLTTINAQAFDGCTSLERVSFNNDGISITQGAFPGDLKAKYESGGTGTYTRNGDVWTRQ
jgi:hypothetical protein